MKAESALFGLVAEFEHPQQLIAAAQQAYAAGYRQMDAFSPIPIEGLAEALGHKRNRVPLLVLLGGVFGGAGGYFMQWFATVVHYPVNVGGRPFHSWPAYVPITFELTILCAAISGVVGMLALNGLPRLYHPMFNAPDFHRASQDRFFLCVETVDALFNPAATRAFLEKLRPLKVSEVEL